MSGDKPTTASGCFGKGCGCMVTVPVLITVLIIAAALVSWYRAERTERERMVHADATEDRMQQFAESHAPEILTGFKVYDQAIMDLAGRCTELRNDLTALGRVPTADPDYRSWQEQLESIQDNKASLRKDLEEAYLAYRKYQLSPDSKVSEEMETALARGRQSALQAKTRYEELKQELNRPTD